MPARGVQSEPTKPGSAVLVWFRRDLRLADNPALRWAARSGLAVLPVYILDESACEAPEDFATRWWLHGSLDSLASSLAKKGSRLTLRRGRAERVLPALVRETRAAAVAWNRRYEPQLRETDSEISTLCAAQGCTVKEFNAGALVEPWDVNSLSGKPYHVFTAFWRQCRKRCFAAPLGPPRVMPPPSSWPASDALPSWKLRSGAPEFAAGLATAWRPGESAAGARLSGFIDQALAAYAQARNYPGSAGTSRLSPHLRFGEIGPRQVVAALTNADSGAASDAFLRQLMWREFCRHLLFHNPQLRAQNLRTPFDRMPWRKNAEDLHCWRHGTTGYPLVDAGMRELKSTGWMHNRARMVVASFLTKHLLTDWRAGAAWFKRYLVDADTANNCAGWQWTAGTGVDAAPYFRVFNPVLQSRRYDPRGIYLRKWIPELTGLPDAHIHAPWMAPASVAQRAGLVLGKDYPLPVVNHLYARKRALEAYASHVRNPPEASPG